MENNNLERIHNNVHLSYRDILLVPYDDEPCQIKSRSQPDISIQITQDHRLKIPLVSAPMDTITGIDMAIAMHKAGGLGVYTRHINDDREEEKQCQSVTKIRESVGDSAPVACAIGVRCDVVKRAELLFKCGANIICLDIANGNHVFMIDAIKEIRKLQDKHRLFIMAGNVATPKAALRLARAGANIIKVGIGPGAGCSTRRVTAFGVPQLTAVLTCAEVLREKGVKVIADGGVRFSGDAVKAIWAGADAVMMGYALAGHKECPLVSLVGTSGKEWEVPSKRTYRGMSSRVVSGRYDIAPEGVSFEVRDKGEVEHTLLEYSAGIKSACSYANAMSLDELRRNVYAIRVSTMSQEESDPVIG